VSARVYPLAAEPGDGRFYTGLVDDVADAITAHGFPALAGGDEDALAALILGFLYRAPGAIAPGDRVTWHDAFTGTVNTDTVREIVNTAPGSFAQLAGRVYPVACSRLTPAPDGVCPADGGGLDADGRCPYCEHAALARFTPGARVSWTADGTDLTGTVEAVASGDKGPLARIAADPRPTGVHEPVVVVACAELTVIGDGGAP
jgi:hypothetical protein